MNTQPVLIVKYAHTMETHVRFIWKQCYLTMHKEEVCVCMCVSDNFKYSYLDDLENRKKKIIEQRQVFNDQ